MFRVDHALCSARTAKLGKKKVTARKYPKNPRALQYHLETVRLYEERDPAKAYGFYDSEENEPSRMLSDALFSVGQG